MSSKHNPTRNGSYDKRVSTPQRRKFKSSRAGCGVACSRTEIRMPTKKKKTLNINISTEGGDNYAEIILRLPSGVQWFFSDFPLVSLIEKMKEQRKRARLLTFDRRKSNHRTASSTAVTLREKTRSYFSLLPIRKC